MNNESNEKAVEKQAMQEAGKNTAHVAGKAAATYFGGTLGNIAYDKLSQTKLGQKIENGAGKIISKTPILNKINKKANDAGAVDAAGKLVDVAGGKGAASKKLGLSKAKAPNKLNKPSNKEVPQNLKRGNSGNFLNNRRVRNNNSEHNNSNPDVDENQDDNIDEEVNNNHSKSSTTKKDNKIKMKLKVLIGNVVMVLAIAFVAIVIILAIISPIISAISSFISFFSVETHKDSDKYYANSEKNEKILAKEIKFNDAIVGSEDGSKKGIIAEYQEEYGVTIDRFLLISTLVYRYQSTSLSITSDFDDDYSDIDFEKELDDFSENDLEDGGSSNNTSNIDYDFAIKRIKDVAGLMIYEEDGIYKTDFSVGGRFYNDLINSNFLNNYYFGILPILPSYEDKKKLVDEIFEYAEYARDIFDYDTPSGSIISDTTIVYLQTCDKFSDNGYYRFKKINGISIYDNPSATGIYPRALNMADYLKGVIYGEIGGNIKEENREAIKALIIAAQTFIIRHRSSGFELKNGIMYFPAGDCKQLCCDPNVGCTYSYIDSKGNIIKYGTSYSGPNRFSNRKFVRQPMSTTESSLLDSILNEIFGDIIVKKGVTSETFAGSNSIPDSAGSHLSECAPGTCFSQKGSLIDAQNGMSYIEILNKYYSNVGNGSGFDIINIKEGLYYENQDNFNGNINLNENFHFHQNNYSESNSFCEGGTISSRGCSVTSTAIAVSLLTNQKHDPVEISNKLKSNKLCNGDRVTYPAKAANLYNLRSYTVRKNESGKINQMLTDLSKGDTVVVARIAPNSGRYYTKSGHYIALVGVKTENGKTKVLVWDPARPDPLRDNFWADFNSDILKYVNNPSFVVLSRR